MAAELPLPGDLAPALALGEWLQRGAYDEVRPVGGRLITVLEFFASWDPYSRYVLPVHDELQSQLHDRGVRFLAIAEEGRESVQAYLGQAKLKHLAVACDDAEGTLRGCTGQSDGAFLPFIAIIEERGEASTLLWTGPPETGEGTRVWEVGYRHDFRTVLTQVVEGRYDAAAMRSVEASSRDLHALHGALLDLARRGQLDEVRTRANDALGRAWPAEYADRLSEALALAGWRLVSADQRTAEAAALGLWLLEEARARVPQPDAELMHFYARALFENGRVEEAVEAQRQVLALPTVKERLPESLHQEALARYERRLAELRGEAVEPAAAATEKPAAAAEPPAPPETVTGAQAADDVRALHDHLRRCYIGYDDSAWALAGAGLSWEEQTEAFARRVEAQEQWPRLDLFHLILEYLAPIRDRHFRVFLNPLHINNGEPWGWPTPRTLVFFTEVQVEEAGGRMQVKTAGDLCGAELVGVPRVPDSRHAEPGCAYLFPTLPDGYLLGVLGHEERAPTEATVAVRREGQEDRIALPLHRGRARREITEWGEWNGAPASSVSDGPVPVLTVRRFWGKGIEELPPTAESLRERPAVVLDLRWNQGGNDNYAVDWCARFTNQPLRLSYGWSTFYPNETEPRRRWSCATMVAFEAEGRGLLEHLAPERYRGRLAVLTDNGTGSSAECMTAMACQIDGAFTAGENSQGCMTYGNADQSFELPHSRIFFTYPRTGCILAGRPFREGLGFFPDYWLDTDDPVKTVTEYLGRYSPSAPPR